MEDKNLKTVEVGKDNGARVKKPIKNQEQKGTSPEGGQPQKQRRFYRPGGQQRRHFYNQPWKTQQKDRLNLANKSVSIVIPLFNEEESLVELSVALKKALDPIRTNWEVIFIDDGSSDSSYSKIQEIHRVNSRFKCIKFKRNYGKSAALQEGFKAAIGD